MAGKAALWSSFILARLPQRRCRIAKNSRTLREVLARALVCRLGRLSHHEKAMKQASETSTYAPVTTTADGSRLPSLSKVALVEWLGQRQRHAVPRLVSIFVMSILGVAFATSVPAPWGIVVLFGAPMATIIISANIVTSLWVRRGRSIGLDGAMITEIRSQLRHLPPRVPFYSGEEMLVALQDRIAGLRKL